MMHPSLAEMPVLEVLRLIRSENVGAITFFHLIRRYGSAGRALEALPDIAKRGGKRQIRVASVADAESELERARLFGARIVLYGQAEYPPMLLEIADAPPLLMVRGKPSLWENRRCVAFVGSRNATQQDAASPVNWQGNVVSRDSLWCLVWREVLMPQHIREHWQQERSV